MSEAGVERVVLWARVLGTQEPGARSSGAAASRSGVPAAEPGGRRSRPPARVEAGASMATAVRGLEARLRAGGGQLHAQLSGQLVASFAAEEALEAVELGLELLEEASGYELAIALARSSTWREGTVLVGHAFDDACFLAARANPGEILVDGTVRDHVPGYFLFLRQVAAGGLRAASIDRRHPRRADCLRALASLAPPPLVPATRALLEPLGEALEQEGALVLLEGPIGAGATELVEGARQARAVRRVLVIGGATGANVPLESLRRALATGPCAPSGPAAALARGEIISLRDAVALLETELDLAAEEGPVAWIVLSPLTGIDHATLEAVGALRSMRARRLRVVARAPLDAAPPAWLGPPTARLTLPALRMDDAREVVAAVLGAGTADDVIRRVAIIGGDSTLGCEEAARLMVSSGELVRSDRGFVWRTSPRGGPEAVPPEELARRRLELLSPDARRALELAVVLAPDAPRELLRAMAQADGMTPRALEGALAVLAAEGWLDDRDPPSLYFVRRFVQRAMPPSRLAELHRFASKVLPTDGPLRLAALHHAVEGGLEERGSELARDLAQALRSAGYTESAATLSAMTLEVSLEARTTPRSESASPHETWAGGSSPPAAEAGAPRPLVAPYSPLDEVEGPDPAVLRRAIQRRDVAAIERWVESATAAGADLAAVARLRAVVDLLSGDVANAEARLARTCDTTGPRPLIAQAMVTLGGGRTADAVRLSLRALALSLRHRDARGSQASLHALAACYRAEGRGADADALTTCAGRHTSSASSSS